MITGYRKHQARAQEIGQRIHSGDINEKFIVAHVTPGGGKTLMASVFSHELLKQDVSQVLVVCPRKTLQTQMRDGFHVPERGLMGGLQVGYASLTSLLRNERAGLVTTYQDVITHQKRWRKFVAERPTLLILDEAHHLQAPGWGVEDGEDRGWAHAIVPLVDKAKRVLLMTGTMKRDNNSPLAFVSYDESTRTPKVHIQYTRRDALDEQAIIHVSVKLCDGNAVYWHSFNQHRHTLSEVSSKEESRALVTLLKDDGYRNRVLEMALSEFAQYRNSRNPDSRMIVICANQKQAKQVSKYISGGGAYRPVLAISDEKDSHRRLARFRDRHEGDVLVTCQMAYEGLDVPSCTHLVALTNFRSRPWLEQALSRVTRFDAKCGLSWDDQCAYLYVPSDPSMINFVGEWIDEQDARCGDPPETSGKDPQIKRSTFVPESGEMTDVFHADTNGYLHAPDQQRLREFDIRFPFAAAMPNQHRLRIARDMWPNDNEIPQSRDVA